ncbi:CapA family protein [Clostridium sp. CS001]|uniref:CapA family protein n=1 Tax=Clostridium sp. CS001 TaxID=2880648 RepID=UPI001CF290D5|nr:CapA family protein [Clostridium sp. CS001]MCB2290386.1 CapA family protein [Clostridium sp. CS001]
MKKSIKALIIICICLAVLIWTMIINIQGDNYKNGQKQESINSLQGKNNLPVKESISIKEDLQLTENPNYMEASVVAVGDIIVHEDQLKAQLNANTGEYNFNNNFKYVKDHIKAADIALANLETTLAGENQKYTGYPRFNSPSSIVDAAKDCGFDVLSTVNNHTIDSGSLGVFSTITEIQKRNLKVVGTRKSVGEKPYIIEDVKGIKVGIISYSYETPRKGKNKTLNALEIPSDVVNLLNTFSYEYIKEDLNKIKTQIDEMKSQGAEAIIFIIHWGNEFERKPNVHQKSIASELCDYGVDVILGSHPHVIQPIEFITSKETGKKSLVVYSMGNFISNQQYERTNNRYTEDGLIVNIQIRKNKTSKEITISEVSYIPTWVHKYSDDNKLVYEIVPLTDALESKGQYNLNEEVEVWRAENSEKSTRVLMGEDSSIIERATKQVIN